jgi:hypothetical protein
VRFRVILAVKMLMFFCTVTPYVLVVVFQKTFAGFDGKLNYNNSLAFVLY